MDSTINQKQGSQRIVRHGEYYIHGGDIIFLVESTLFRVHRYFFTRDSAYFRNKLPHPPAPGEFTKGTSDSQPLVLEDALQVEFERFLWVFYNPKYSLYDASVEEWTSILKLAHQWDFIGVKTLAVRELEQLKIPPLQKIAIYHSYAIDRHLLQAAYTAFAIRDEPITLEEGRELGLETVLQLAHARELVRAPATGGKRIKDAYSPVNVAGADLDELIRDIFQLSPPERDADSQVSQRKPTKGGTVTGGRAEPPLGTQPNGKESSETNLVQGMDRTSKAVANGHANDTPASDGTKGAQANGTPKGQRVNGK